MKQGFICLLIGVIFAGAAAGVYFGLVSPIAEDRKIAESGTDGIGYVTDVNTNTEVNDEERFRIEFAFYNEAGTLCRDKTGDVYRMAELESMGICDVDWIQSRYSVNAGAEIDIRYIGDKAVVMPYEAGVLGWLGWVLVIVFALAALGLLAAAVKGFNGARVIGQIKETGFSGTGAYINHTSGMMINGVPYFKIHYSYTNENGTYVETKTGSSYRQHEAEAFAAMRTFPIKFKGNKAVVMLGKNEILASRGAAAPVAPQPASAPVSKTQDPFSQSADQPKLMANFCRYCGAGFTGNEKFCQNCGSKKE